MDDKKAFIFDTNFIIQNKNLAAVIENLKSSFNVYVTQTSIDERIAQQCRELETDYEELDKRLHIYKRFADINIKSTYAETCEKYRVGIQNSYNTLFKENIIPFPEDVELLEVVYSRALKKTPPFSTAKESSDKGFKDTILWISIIEFFKNNGENEILFLTDDKGFEKSKNQLEKEFLEETGKTIIIEANDYYKELISKTDEIQASQQNEPEEIEDVDSLRDEINNTFQAICKTEVTDEYGFEYIDKTFRLYTFLTPADTASILNNMQQLISLHLFEKSIVAYELFDNVTDKVLGYRYININVLEKALKLSQSIVSKYPEYTEQFLLAVTHVFNQNYEVPPSDDDDDLPF